MNVKKVEIKVGTRIEKFRPILEKYQDYKACLRDIKLNSIFGKKVQFDIENILPHLVIYKYDKRHLIDVGWQKEIRIIKMKFIINSDLEVEDLELFCDGEIQPEYKIKIRNLSESEEIYGFLIELE